jgi:hypothetical protein
MKPRHARIRARRDYRDCISREIVHVTGWEQVTVGIGTTERTELWCRTRAPEDMWWNGKQGCLCHPSRLIPLTPEDTDVA